MTKNNLRTNLSLKILNFSLVSAFALGIFIVSANAQSTDPFNPTPMTTDTVKGRWSTGNPSYYYSFVAGPGVVVISFNAKPANGIFSDLVGGELLDASGRAIIPVENRNSTRGSTVQGPIFSDGKVFVGTYELKRKQKLTFRFYNWGEETSTGTYSIKVSGDGVAFDDNNSPTTTKTTSNKTSDNKSTSSKTSADDLSCLPKSGKIRLVMDDGTVQEINLSRVKEASLKP